MIEKIPDFSGLSGVLSPLLPLLFVDFQFSSVESDGVFVQRNDNEIAAAFSVRNGCSNFIKISDDLDIEEIMYFYHFLGVKNVVSDFALNSSFQSFVFLKASSETKITESDGVLTPTSVTNEYRGVFDLLENGEADFNDWFPSFSKRINKGNAAAVYYKDNNEIISCAVSPAVYSENAVIGGVFTDLHFRGKGFGSLCVNALVNVLNTMGVKTVFLWCENHNIDFYRRLGFSVFGQVYISEDF